MERAHALAGSYGARIHLLHAVSPLPYPPEFGYGTQILEDLEERARRLLERAARELRGRGTEVAEHLEKSMPSWAKLEPLSLFRTWARHLPLAKALRPIGRLVLAEGALDPVDREILILRVCALCGAEYEWGVHAVSYPPHLGIPEEKVAATVYTGPEDPIWSERERLLLRLADSLHETAQVDDALFAEVAAHWSEEQVLELLLVAGFYHAVNDYCVVDELLVDLVWTDREICLAGLFVTVDIEQAFEAFTLPNDAVETYLPTIRT